MQPDTIPPTIPLFPLHAVLFPGGPLRLRIFETRYVDMIGHCMREGSGFGVVMITAGPEVAGPVSTAHVGTLARIVDFEKLADGLLGISARGEQSFRVIAARRQEDGLNIADVEWLPHEPAIDVPEGYTFLAEALRRVLPQLGDYYGDAAPRYDDAAWLGARLCEILPLPLADRQRCLEMRAPLERLAFLENTLRDLPSGPGQPE